MTQEETNKLILEEITKLNKRIDALQNNATIPFDIGEAIKTRVLSDAGVAATSTKGATSENTSVLVSTGPNVFAAVLREPDGFLEITITGVKYFIPFYL